MPAFARHALAVILFTAALPSAYAANPSVSDVVKRYAEARLGSPALQVSDVQITSGHASFNIPSAVAVPVLAGDEQVGVYLRGNGSFTYTTSEQLEFPAVRYNARGTKVKVEGGSDSLKIAEQFRDLLLWGNPLPKLTGSPAAVPSADFEAHRKTFGSELGAPAAHRFAMHLLEAPTARFQRAEVIGDRIIAHEYDDAWYHSETIEVLQEVDETDPYYKNFLTGVLLSEQPIGRDLRKPVPARFMLTDVDLHLEASDKREAKIKVTETIVPQGNGASILRFDQYHEIMVGGKEQVPRRYIVKGVTDEKGAALPFHHDGHQLLVSLPQRAAAGKPLKLHFEIEGDFLHRPGGDSYWQLGVGPWFPQPEFNEQAYTYHGVIKVRKPFVPFSPGKTIRREVEGEYNVVETRLENPVQFVTILAGKYSFEEETRNGITVRVASYGMKNPGAMKVLTKLAFSIIEWYPMFLGPFPFPELNIIEKNDYGYGQAPAATVFITKEAFSPLAEDSAGWGKGVNARFAHEIAHQYWAHVVKMPSAEEQWISEAFSDYSAALFLREARGQAGYKGMLAAWKGSANAANDVAPIPMANRLRNDRDGYATQVARIGLIYDKGAYLLAALHKELGDETFLTFLKSYQKSFRWKYGYTKDVVGLLQFMTKKDYGPFFEQYYWGTAMPEIKK